MAKELTEHESFVQFLRAFDRLRVKELIAGPVFVDPKVGEDNQAYPSIAKLLSQPCCCAIGVADMHNTNANVIETLSADDLGGAPRFDYNYLATSALIGTNEGYLQRVNDKATRKARFKHVRAWLVRRVKATRVTTI